MQIKKVWLISTLITGKESRTDEIGIFRAQELGKNEKYREQMKTSWWRKRKIKLTISN